MFSNDKTRTKLLSVITALALAMSSFSAAMESFAFADDTEDSSMLEESDVTKRLEGASLVDDDGADSELSADTEAGSDDEADATGPGPDEMVSEDDIALPEEASDAPSSTEPMALTDEPAVQADYPDGINWQTVTNAKGESGTCVWGLDGTTLYVRPPDGATSGTLPPLKVPSTYADMAAPWQRSGVTKAVILPNVIAGSACSMFFEMYKMKEVVGLENLDISNTISLDGMFYDCRVLTSIDIPDWDAPQLEEMQDMFGCCAGLQSLSLGAMYAPKVTNMQAAFQACKKLTSIDLSDFYAPSVTNMAYLFAQDEKLTSIIWPKRLDTSHVIYMTNMFWQCKALVSLDLSGFDTSSVKDMEEMFCWCTSLRSLNLSSFDTKNVINAKDMFYLASKIAKVTISSQFTFTTQLNTSGKVWYALSGDSCVNGKIPETAQGEYAVIEKVTVSEPTKTVAVSDEPFVLTAEVTPDIVKEPVTWSSSDPDIATVDSTTGKVTMLKGGTARIIADLFGVRGTCTLTVVSVTLSETEKTVGVDSAPFKLNASLLPTTLKDTVAWTSSDTSVATVDDSGNVTMTGAGTTEITAECDGATDVCHLTVVSVSLSETARTAYPGTEPFKLFATVSPDTITESPTWSSSDDTVATVDSDGMVTALKPGSAEIIAAIDGIDGTRAVCALTVKSAEVFLGETEKTVSVDSAPFTLNATVAPDSVIAPVVWSSSDDTVASVDSNGTVTVHKTGTAEITAECAGAKDTCALTVVSLSLKETEKTVSVTSAPFTLESMLAPSTVAGPIMWTSSSPDVASVGTDGTVTVHKAGTAEITAEFGGAKDTCALTVVSVSLSETEKTAYLGEEPFRLAATIAPDAGTGSVVWTSSDTDVATVSTDGIVTVHEAGTADITVALSGVDGAQAVCALSVEMPNVTLSETEKTVSVTAEPFKLFVTVAPDTVTAPVTWSSSDTDVATVDSNGIVTVHKAGNAEISVECAGSKAVCALTVETPEMTLNETEKTVDMNAAPFKLVATITPSTETDSIAWTSSDTDVATVDADGMVVVQGMGTAKITAKLAGVDGIQAVCTLTVKRALTLSEISKKVRVDAEPFILTALVNPAPTEGTVEWSSSDESVATVEPVGSTARIADTLSCEVTVHKAGTTSITAEIDDVTATCALTVEENKKPGSSGNSGGSVGWGGSDDLLYDTDGTTDIDSLQTAPSPASANKASGTGANNSSAKAGEVIKTGDRFLAASALLATSALALPIGILLLLTAGRIVSERNERARHGTKRAD